MIALLEGLKIVSKAQPHAVVRAADGIVWCGEVDPTSEPDKKLLDALGWFNDHGMWATACDGPPRHWWERRE